MMGKWLQLILRTLDGTPQLKQGRQQGQSLVEMAFITPLLAIMIAGIVELGWYANNVLILQEVARVGARAGTVLTGDLDPILGWDNRGSIHRAVYEDANTTITLPVGGTPETDAHLEFINNTRGGPSFDNCPTAISGFYPFIACLMLNSMDPLTIRPNGVDDLVISVFSLQAVNNGNYLSITDDPALRRRTINLSGFNDVSDNPYINGPQVIVIGRYPTNANECSVENTPGGGGQYDVSRSVRDPFDYLDGFAAANPSDYLEINKQDWYLDGADPVLAVELEGYDPPSSFEYQRGFVWTGQHMVERTDTFGDTYCYGSEWSNERVQALMNLPSLTLDIEEREYLPGQGMTLVEIFWEHRLLLDFPLFTPAVRGFGALDGDGDSLIRISTWAAFPLPSAEPNIYYRIENN